MFQYCLDKCLLMMEFFFEIWHFFLVRKWQLVYFMFTLYESVPILKKEKKPFKRLHLVKTTSWQHRFLDFTNLAPCGLVPMSTWKVPYRLFFFGLKQGFQSGFFRFGQKFSKMTLFWCTWKNHYFEHFGVRQRLAGL